MKPLAERMRPQNLDMVVGQRHLIGKNKVLSNIVKSSYIPNMIFYGPPGCGKTTVANIIAKCTSKRFFKLNATTASTKDIKEIIGEISGFMSEGILLYLDEIQNFNKKQQQSLLEFIENGAITLICSTTENPHFYIYNAILSRCNVFEFKIVEITEIISTLKRAALLLQEDFISTKLVIEEEAYKYIAYTSGGDVRKALNALELCAFSINANEDFQINITKEAVREISQIKIISFDKDGDNHYDIVSAFQKSIRGSDVDAAIHYLARLIKGGDLISICRRLLVIAAEDIGLAYPQGISIVKSCVDTAMQVGLPEARLPLSQAVILLASSPKSNSATLAIETALKDLEEIDDIEIPPHLKDAHYPGAKNLLRGIDYKYPHNYENNYVEQQYMPDKLKDRIYYNYGNNKFEKASKAFINSIKSKQ